MGDKASAKDAMRAAGLPLVPGLARPAGLARGGGADRGGRRLPGAAEGGGRRRRSRHAPGGGSGGSRDLFRAASQEAQAAFGDGGMYLEKAVVAAHHVEIQVICDRLRRRAHLRRARVLDPAPPPEAARGGAVAVPRRRSRASAMAEAAETRLPRDLLPERRHDRVPGRRRSPVLLHGDEHAAAGRASRHRGRHRHRPGARAAARRRPASACRARAGPRCAATRSSSASTPRIRRRASCRAPAW